MNVVIVVFAVTISILMMKDEHPVQHQPAAHMPSFDKPVGTWTILGSTLGGFSRNKLNGFQLYFTSDRVTLIYPYMSFNVKYHLRINDKLNSMLILRAPHFVHNVPAASYVRIGDFLILFFHPGLDSTRFCKLQFSLNMIILMRTDP